MDKLVTFVGKVAITTIYIEVAMIAHEWLKQAKIDTDLKEATVAARVNPLDISTELDEIKSRLDDVELG